MAIRYVSGDLLGSSAHVLVVPVNCQGVAGCGLALQCRQRYPEWFLGYQFACQMGCVAIGSLTHAHDVHADGRLIVDFPTKQYWRHSSRLEDIEQGLVALVLWLEARSEWVCSVAVPKLGCGAGGLSWEQVQPLMERYLGALSRCDVLIYV